MSSNNMSTESRVMRAAADILARQHYVSLIDVFIHMGWLQRVHFNDWRKGKLAYLDEFIQVKPEKYFSAIQCFHDWGLEKKLKPADAVFQVKTVRSDKNLQCSCNADPDVEAAYIRYYISPLLPEKQQEKLVKKVDDSPELLVFITTGDSSECSRCNKKICRGACLFKEGDQALCMECAGLDALVFLPSGDALLTRRAKKMSQKYAVVVKFSRSRQRYERQGLLVEETALQAAENQINNERKS